MKVLGHDHVSDHDETVPLAGLFQNAQEEIAATSRVEPGYSVITTARDEVQVSAAVIPLQTCGHGERVHPFTGERCDAAHTRPLQKTARSGPP